MDIKEDRKDRFRNRIKSFKSKEELSLYYNKLAELVNKAKLKDDFEKEYDISYRSLRIFIESAFNLTNDKKSTDLILSSISNGVIDKNDISLFLKLTTIAIINEDQYKFDIVLDLFKDKYDINSGNRRNKLSHLLFTLATPKFLKEIIKKYPEISLYDTLDNIPIYYRLLAGYNINISEDIMNQDTLDLLFKDKNKIFEKMKILFDNGLNYYYNQYNSNFNIMQFSIEYKHDQLFNYLIENSYKFNDNSIKEYIDLSIKNSNIVSLTNIPKQDYTFDISDLESAIVNNFEEGVKFILESNKNLILNADILNRSIDTNNNTILNSILDYDENLTDNLEASEVTHLFKTAIFNNNLTLAKKYYNKFKEDSIFIEDPIVDKVLIKYLDQYTSLPKLNRETLSFLIENRFTNNNQSTYKRTDNNQLENDLSDLAYESLLESVLNKIRYYKDDEKESIDDVLIYLKKLSEANGINFKISYDKYNTKINEFQNSNNFKYVVQNILDLNLIEKKDLRVHFEKLKYLQIDILTFLVEKNLVNLNSIVIGRSNINKIIIDGDIFDLRDYEALINLLIENNFKPNLDIVINTLISQNPIPGTYIKNFIKTFTIFKPELTPNIGNLIYKLISHKAYKANNYTRITDMFNEVGISLDQLSNYMDTDEFVKFKKRYGNSFKDRPTLDITVDNSDFNKLSAQKQYKAISAYKEIFANNRKIGSDYIPRILIEGCSRVENDIIYNTLRNNYLLSIKDNGIDELQIN
jgi:hypothetical protein